MVRSSCPSFVWPGSGDGDAASGGRSDWSCARNHQLHVPIASVSAQQLPPSLLSRLHIPTDSNICALKPTTYLTVSSTILHKPHTPQTLLNTAMLDLHTLANLLAISFLLAPRTSALPLWPNITTPDAPATACSTPTHSPTLATKPTCQIFYPSSYRVMNSRYPAWDQTPLHSAQDFFMLLRQRTDTFQVATQVQFDGLGDAAPPNSSRTCRLQFQLPAKEMQTVLGPAPVVNVYQVAREAGAPASWSTYGPVLAANSSGSVPPPAVFGTVDGAPTSQERAWNQTAGLVDVGTTQCNETLTWHMGMAVDGGEEVNYWDFIGVDPPFNPVQGFRVVMGC